MHLSLYPHLIIVEYMLPLLEHACMNINMVHCRMHVNVVIDVYYVTPRG